MWWRVDDPRRMLTRPSRSYRYQVFISYTTRESEVQVLKPFIDGLIAHLEDHDVPVVPIYYDGWYLKRRQYLPRKLSSLLYEAIEQSAFTLAFLSPGYIDSPWCAFEWDATYEIHKRRPSPPALEYSLLPVVWKRLPVISLTGAAMLFKVRRRLRRPAATVNITNAAPQESGGWQYEATAQVLNTVREYLVAWNPEYQFSF